MKTVKEFVEYEKKRSFYLIIGRMCVMMCGPWTKKQILIQKRKTIEELCEGYDVDEVYDLLWLEALERLNKGEFNTDELIEYEDPDEVDIDAYYWSR